MSGDVTATEERSYLARKLPLFKLSAYQAKFICEGIGTFIFVMTISLAEVNCGAAAINGKTRTRNLAPIAEGFMLSVLVFTFGYISGGHFNPAVTFAAMLVQAMRMEEAVAYWIAQVIGGVLGAVFGTLVNGFPHHLPAPQVYQNLPGHVLTGFIAEALFAGFLVTVVLHVAYSRQRNNHYYGLAIGMCLLAAGYSVGGVSGGAFNPAVATGLQLTKCIAAGYCIPLMHLWLYWAAPAAGAVGASLLFKMTHPVPQETEEEARRKALQRSARHLYGS
ncbi:aquaporin-like protein [Trypanosoma rangeli]|uniref:Aquaporin-like protein n=1 Tax=Trypanosoma rangeli TaxID=5698 RepID=A0A3R7RFH0_TRYRA|nr:aquaporin-like protein [Trypanosoma rangeli]RNF01660.1 aquaporin-like protein [Trypanosoma rangeli]|eukprot:RNF01660.1 aquaporin-like protein [Trypanosoma rangeli]